MLVRILRLLRLIRKPAKAEQKDDSLFGIRGGVYIREPNGSEHPIQNLIEQALVERGMALFNLRHDSAGNLLKTGEWDDNIAQALIDVAIVGRVVVRMLEGALYQTIRHIHTATGRYFSDLPETDFDYRQPTHWLSRCDGRVYAYNMYSTLYPFFFESKLEYERRKELESGPRSTVSLDVRFYGRHGEIHGGCVVETVIGNPFGLQEIVTKLAEELGLVARRSLQAHSTSLAEQELLGPGSDRLIPR